jgi:RNA polymerase sigma factor (sigma-70 family)
MAMAQDRNSEFERFVVRSRGTLQLRALAICGDWHTAEDLLQDALVIVHRRWDDIESSARNSYVRTVMVRLTAQQRSCARSQRESIRAELPEPRKPVQERSQLGIEVEIADRLAIEDALAELPNRQRNAIQLRYWWGLSTEEIARILRVPKGTVRSDLCRAATGLRRALLPSFPQRVGLAADGGAEIDRTKRAS